MSRPPGPATPPLAPDRPTRRAAQGLDALAARLAAAAGRRHPTTIVVDDLPPQDRVASRADLRWRLTDVDPLGASRWYRQQTAADQAALGLARMVAFVRAGIAFETVLVEGLRRFVEWSQPSEPVCAFVEHEVDEEERHTLMFEAFVDWSREPSPGSVGDASGFERAQVMAVDFPQAFFLAALSGEEPIDHVQRSLLRRPDGQVHPLFRAIMRQHVSDEARHLAFARAYLGETTATLSRRRQRQLQIEAPRVVRTSAEMMLGLSVEWLVGVGLDEEDALEVAREAEDHPLLAASIAPIRRLCARTGLLTDGTAALWRRAGLLPADAGASR